MPGFTPAQQTLHGVLRSADRKHVEIAHTILTGWLATGLETGPEPKDLGVDVDSPKWKAIEDAFAVFDEAAPGSDEEQVRAALDVTTAVLAAR